LTVGGDVIGINRSASNAVAALDVSNRQITVFGDKILDLENGFRKLGSVAVLQSLIRTSLAQLDTEMAEKYAN